MTVFISDDRLNMIVIEKALIRIYHRKEKAVKSFEGWEETTAIHFSNINEIKQLVSALSPDL
mgnify:CR=1 FL=1